jgi:homoserine O-acetyltransferase
MERNDAYQRFDLGDVTPPRGSTVTPRRALGSITAKAIVMPAEKDLYFPPEDEEWEVSCMPDAELRVIPGGWGHFAGCGANPVDTSFIDRALAQLLAS